MPTQGYKVRTTVSPQEEQARLRPFPAPAPRPGASPRSSARVCRSLTSLSARVPVSGPGQPPTLCAYLFLSLSLLCPPSLLLPRSPHSTSRLSPPFSVYCLSLQSLGPSLPPLPPLSVFLVLVFLAGLFSPSCCPLLSVGFRPVLSASACSPGPL